MESSTEKLTKIKQNKQNNIKIENVIFYFKNTFEKIQHFNTNTASNVKVNFIALFVFAKTYQWSFSCGNEGITK